uniref:Uncharacterized protein n=1 Tax=Varanus komodoensis TaxID=61221 RepID=A0A8D2KV89_VARKO
MMQKKTELQGFHQSFKGENPFNLKFSQSDHLEFAFIFKYSSWPNMLLSQPINIPNAKKQN